MKKSLFVIVLMCGLGLNAQNSSRVRAKASTADKTIESNNEKISVPVIDTNHRSVEERFYAGFELGGYPSDADISFINIYGLLSFYYNFNSKFYISPHFHYKIASTTDYQTLSIDGKNIDMSSFNEYGAGLAFGYKLMPFKKFNITPELKMTYTEYNMQDVSFVDTLENFINHSFMGMNPRLHMDLRMSDKTSLGFVGGYILPLYIRGDKTAGYNPQTFTYGLSLKYYLTK